MKEHVIAFTLAQDRYLRYLAECEQHPIEYDPCDNMRKSRELDIKELENDLYDKFLDAMHER